MSQTMEPQTSVPSRKARILQALLTTWMWVSVYGAAGTSIIVILAR